MPDRDRLPFELPPLPEAFAVLGHRRAVLAVREDLAPALADLGYGPDADGRRAPSDLAGRRPLAELRLADRTLVVRRFHHGGLLGGATGERFGDPRRPFVELALAARLRAEGVPTPEVVAARARRLPLFGWQLEVLSVRVEGSLDLGHAHAARARGEVAGGPWRACLTAVGELLARLHGLGFVHADLQPANLLVSRAALAGEVAPEVQPLDLDRSRFVSPLPEGARRDNLRRLARHVLQRAEAGGPRTSRADRMRVLRAYQPDRAARHADWRAIARAHGEAAGWHRLGRRLERLTGQRRPADTRSG